MISFIRPIRKELDFVGCFMHFEKKKNNNNKQIIGFLKILIFRVSLSTTHLQSKTFLFRYNQIYSAFFTDIDQIIMNHLIMIIMIIIFYVNKKVLLCKWVLESETRNINILRKPP